MSESILGIGKKPIQNNPQKWYNAYRNDEEKCVFVGKDGCSGLIRATDKATGKKFEWRSTDMLAKESGLSKKRVEEILEHYCNKRVVRQHAKDPEKWGYWELVGNEKDDPDVVAKDHEARMEKQQQFGAGKKPTPTVVTGGVKMLPYPSLPGTAKPPVGKGTAPKPPVKAPAPKPRTCGTPVPATP